MEGGVKGTEHATLFPFPIAPPDSIKRYLNREEIVTSVVTGRGPQIKKTIKRAKLTNEMVGKGKSQPRSSPEIPRPGTEQLRALDNPFEGIPAVDVGKDNQMSK